MAFQNEEKEKREAELINTNQELKIAEDAIIQLNEELEQKKYYAPSNWNL